MTAPTRQLRICLRNQKGPASEVYRIKDEPPAAFGCLGTLTGNVGTGHHPTAPCTPYGTNTPSASTADPASKVCRIKDDPADAFGWGQ
jgi:hypothetical protein